MLRAVVELAGYILEAAGVLVIVLGSALVAARIVVDHGHDWYRRLRQGVGKAILLGLELLVGADIIRTVSEHATLRAVSVLGLIVLIRTFLSFTLEVELEGRWPWSRPASLEPKEHKGADPTRPSRSAGSGRLAPSRT